MSIAETRGIPAGPRPWWRRLCTGKMAYGVFVAVLSCGLVMASQRLAFMNQYDFYRVTPFFAGQYLDPAQQLWPLLAEPRSLASHRLDMALLLFALLARLQSWWGTVYDLATAALIAKLVLVLYAHLLAGKIARAQGAGHGIRALVFLAIAVCFFCSHNIAMLNSFYTEYAFFVFFPLILLGMASESARARRWLMLLGALLVGLAKIQFFYVPLLLLLVLAIRAWRDAGKLDNFLVAGLVVAQGVCLVSLKGNDYTQINYYHSLYFGSYMVLSKDQLAALGLSPAQMACVGVDAHGNKAEGPGGTDVTGNWPSCYKKEVLTLADVLAPYVRFPLTLFKFVVYAAPHYRTVQYFHVFKNYPYLKPADGATLGAGAGLIAASLLRDAVVSAHAGLLLLLGLGLGLAKSAARGGLATPVLFLSLFAVSQLVISLLGEGLRDLGKHLWAAQLGLDLLVAFCLFQVFALVRQRRAATA